MKYLLIALLFLPALGRADGAQTATQQAVLTHIAQSWTPTATPTNAAATPTFTVTPTPGTVPVLGTVAVSNLTPPPTALPYVTALPTATPLPSISNGATTGINISPAFDYDANSLPASTRRGAPTISTYITSSGPTTIWAGGYGLLYSLIVSPGSVTGTTISLLDGATTRTTVSGSTAYQYVWARGVAFATTMTVNVSAGWNGTAACETTR